MENYTDLKVVKNRKIYKVLLINKFTMILRCIDMEEREARIRAEREAGNFGFTPESAKYNLPQIDYQTGITRPVEVHVPAVAKYLRPIDEKKEAQSLGLK
ncbi:hypothetical protein HYU07_06850 [Candidatus Woesearchaeota archaeon]|nr:hypothetical protein [Candidatus Woesearchaeota archaeon]